MGRELMRALFFLLIFVGFTSAAEAEDGHRLWLRYDALPASAAQAYSTRAAAIAAPGASPTIHAASDE
jgi:alpha-glucuronidase